MDCKDSAEVVGLSNRRLSAQRKLPKRVSFKDETWVIHIPSREESPMDWQDSVVFTRNAVARNSWINRTDIMKRRASLETFSATSLYTNGRQRSPQIRVSSSGNETNRAPYKSIRKNPSSPLQMERYLNRTYLPARNGREVPRHSIDNYNYFKQDSNHLFPSKDTINRLDKPALVGTAPVRNTSISRSLDIECGTLNNKTTRFLGQDISSSRTSVGNDFHRNERTRTITSAKQPQVNFDIVGVTYGRVDKMPYFYDISGIMNSVKESAPASYSPNNRTRLEHSTVSTTNQLDSRRDGRNLSAIPAIPAFSRKNRGTRQNFSSAWTRGHDSSPKSQLPAELPIAWQPAKHYNFSTK